ncbi:MAG: hypothetical protein H0X16_07870 [Chloroflexi bacterium]|nr:hypothetical protein [Chloroflexota bacterium]
MTVQRSLRLWRRTRVVRLLRLSVIAIAMLVVQAVPVASAPDVGGTPVPAVSAGRDRLDGHLFLGDRGPFEGRLGSYCYEEACHDSAWIVPKRGPTAMSGTIYSVALGDEAEITTLFARYAPASLTFPDAQDLQELVVETRPPATRFVFSGVPPGDWVLVASVYFQGGVAAFSWRVRVTDPSDMPDTSTWSSVDSAVEPLPGAAPSGSFTTDPTPGPTPT